ncbi:MAG: AI-2E family transporter [Patescibacteria group bacterium]
MPKNLAKPFILILVVLVIIACYWIFKPFLTEIFVAAILASVFYGLFVRFTKLLKGRRKIAAGLMCLLLLVIVIIPAINIVAYAASQSVIAYNEAVEFFSTNDLNGWLRSGVVPTKLLRYFEGYDLRSGALQNALLDAFKNLSDWLIALATVAIKETTNFIFSLILIIATMFFFFINGKEMLERLKHLLPLPERYNHELFEKFQTVSRTTFISTFVAAISQGLIGALGFAIIGFPAFLAGVIIGVLSFLPYIGSALFYVPLGIYYILSGAIWQGVFILIWGFLLIGTVDNIIIAYMIKDKAEINPIFVLFAILGGIAIFGFWGVIIGPLVVALAVTVFHIYEMEFCDLLENETPRPEK